MVISIKTTLYGYKMELLIIVTITTQLTYMNKWAQCRSISHQLGTFWFGRHW